MKPVLLVDVDGVLNPFMMGHNKWEKRGFSRHNVTIPASDDPTTPTYRVYLSAAHKTMLESLEDVCDVVWATTWNHLANGLLAPLLKLKQYPVLELDQAAPWLDRSLCWKTSQIKAAFSPNGAYAGRSFAWLDDDTTKRDRAYFDGLFGKNFHKLVLVDPGQGLTSDQVDAVRTWATTPKVTDAD